jgi:ABC-type lipoprotein release transport system permease subunit
MFKLAWRNLWRNKRRTLITIASIFFSVVLAILMRGYHGGAWASLLENVLHSYTGYLQVHAKGYWNEKTLDYTMEWNDSLKNKILENKDVKATIPRVESFALASAGEKTKGVIVVGIEPDIEESFTKLSQKVVTGYMLKANDNEAMLSQRLARFLNLHVGDTLTLLSQGYQGASAAGIFRVKAIVKLPSPEWDNQLVYLPLRTAQNFYSLQGRLTSIVVDLHRPKRLDRTAINLTKHLDKDKYEVMTWKEMLVELYQQYITDESGGKIFLALLYLIIGFGIFGTVMMMTSERVREFGVLIAVGMKKHRLISLVSGEMFFIALLGVMAGMVASIPIIVYFHFNPIHLSGEYAQTLEAYGMEPVIPVLWQAGYILNQGLVVFGLTLIAIAYPMYSIGKLKVIKAIRA